MFVSEQLKAIIATLAANTHFEQIYFNVKVIFSTTTKKLSVFSHLAFPTASPDSDTAMQDSPPNLCLDPAYTQAKLCQTY